MSKNHFFLFLLGNLILFSSSMYAQNIVNIGIGPVWPKNLLNTDKPTAWNATVEYGRVFDDIIGVGCDFDFTWNNLIDDTVIVVDSLTTKTIDKHVKRWFMFPLSVFLFVDPVSNFVIHPVLKTQIGFNMAVKSEKGYDSLGNKITRDDSGFYYGILGKASIDGVYDLGSNAAVFLGFEYQWGSLRRKVKGKTNESYKPKFHGPGIRMGFSFVF